MMNTHAIQCQIGKSSPDKISPECKNFYSWLSGIIFASSNYIEFDVSQTIPIPNDLIQNKPGSTYDLVYDKLKEIEMPGIFIFDIDIRMSGQLRAKSYQQILLAISHWIQESQHPANIILLVDCLPSPEDVISKEIKEITKKTKIVVVDENGNSSPDTAIPTTKFCKRIIEAKKSPRLAVANKMIRHIGHFQKNKGSAKLCVRHFYDGRYCVSDIAKLLLIKLVDEIQEGATICYHSKRSPWVCESMLDLENMLLAYKIINTKFQDIAHEDSTTQDGDYYLILDFIDTGNTVLRTIEKMGTDPKRIISILAKRSGNDRNKIKELERQGDSVLKVEYLMEAEYKKLGPETYGCPLCKIDIPVDSLSKLSTSGPLRSLDFWEMVLDCDINELNPPKHRSPGDKTINMSGAIKQYGAFLAMRVRQIMDNIKSSPDTALIYPKGEQVSGEFALHLYYLSNENHIAIPREAIDSAAAKNAINHDEHSQETWYTALQPGSIKQCIIIDDILVTGSSMLGMKNIVEDFGKEVLAYIPIVEFCGRNTMLRKEKIYPLYSIDEVK